MNRYKFRNKIETESKKLGLDITCGAIQKVTNRETNVTHFRYPIFNGSKTSNRIEYHPNTRKIFIKNDKGETINLDSTNLSQLKIRLEELLSY